MRTGVEAYFDDPVDIQQVRMKDVIERGIIVALALGVLAVISVLVVRHENARPKVVEKIAITTLPEPEIPINVARGYEFLKDNDLGSAEACFAREVEQTPNSFLALLGRGIAVARSTSYAQAESDFLDAAKLNPQSVVVYMNLGYLKLLADNHSDAIQYFSKAISIDPNLASAYGNRARCNFALGQYYDAVDDLSHVIRLDSYNAVAYVNRAIALGKLQRYETAVTNLLHPAIDAAGTQQARKLAALFQAKSQNAMDSLKTCRLGLETNPKDIELKLLSLTALKLIADEPNRDSATQQTLTRTVSEFNLSTSQIAAAKVGLEDLENAFQTIGCCAPILLLPSEGASSAALRSGEAALALLEQADGFLKVGDLESASVCLREAAWNDPGNSETSLKLVLTLIDQRRNDLAQRVLAEMLTRNPNSTNLLELKSMVDSRLGQFRLAIQSLNRLISLSKDNRSAYLQRAMVRYLEGSDYDAVLKDCARAERLGLTDAAVLDLKGRAWMKLGKTNWAIQAFGSAIALTPEEPSYLIHRSACLRSIGKFREASVDAKKAIQIASISLTAEAHLELAHCCFDGAHYELALAEVIKAQRVKNTPEALTLKAETLFKLKKYDDAIRAILQINGSHRTEANQILLANTYLQTSDLRSAWDTALPLASKSNSTASSLTLAGKIACEKRDYGQAITLLEKAIALEPTSSEAHYLLGRSAGGKNDWIKSIEHFRTSLELNEKNSDVWLAAGNAFEKQQIHSKAVACFSKVVAIDSQSQDARLARAGALVKMGDYETAMADLKWLTSRKSDLPEVERLMGVCTEKLVMNVRR